MQLPTFDRPAVPAAKQQQGSHPPCRGQVSLLLLLSDALQVLPPKRLTGFASKLNLSTGHFSQVSA